MTRYDKFVQALMNLTKNSEKLPMKEDEWHTRPEADSYGTVNLDFEAGQLNADDVKEDAAYEGSVDLFSSSRNGNGWRPLIEGTLTEYCGACWGLNSRQYERETGLAHWEYVFQITDEEAGES